MSFTDQKPRIATERDVFLWGGKKAAGKKFRCYLCGHKFQVGDQWRWVYVGGAYCNFITCEKCDGADVKDRWVALNEEFNNRFWWFRQQLKDLYDNG